MGYRAMWKSFAPAKWILPSSPLPRRPLAALLREGQRLAWERQTAPGAGVSPDDWSMLCRAALLLSNAALVSPLDDVDYAKEYSFSRIRGILSGLTLGDWDALRPVGSHLSGEFFSLNGSQRLTVVGPLSSIRIVCG